ncbi:hypothetical protein OB955_25030 [Halobacteria archaeon AArc-m2/3/4]|uniref:DUF7692 domain-containing protein n=1 Tax=Natronoglomus mannanivorans TaxID=2979990 RepID=A0ABT2QLY6_9EURY|nr:hypothetical protein [Halobacteria archaeon AArc-m2/3/4]
MAQNTDVPGSIRIRTDDGNEWRYDAIQAAADYYDCNRSNAAAFACADIRDLVRNATRVLNREDLTLEQRREIAATLSTHSVTFDVVADVQVEKGRD